MALHSPHYASAFRCPNTKNLMKCCNCILLKEDLKISRAKHMYLMQCILKKDIKFAFAYLYLMQSCKCVQVQEQFVQSHSYYKEYFQMSTRLQNESFKQVPKNIWTIDISPNIQLPLDIWT